MNHLSHPPMLSWVLVLALLSQTLVIIPVISTLDQDQKTYYPAPSGGSSGSYGNPSPPHSSGGGGHHHTPSHSSPNCGNPPHKTPSHKPPSSGGYTPKPPSTGGGGGSYTPTPTPPSTGGGGGGYTPTPTPPSTGGGGGGGYTPTPTVPTPTPTVPTPTPDPPSTGGGGGYTPTPDPPSTGGGGGYTPTPDPPSSGGGGYYNPPSTPDGGSPPLVDTPPISYSPPDYSPPISYSPPTVPIDPGTPTFPGSNPPYTCIYWGNHPDMIWGLLGWWGTVGGVFGVVPVISPSLSLQQALSNNRLDGVGSLYREGTASLLNSMIDRNFPFSTQQVKDSFVASVVSDKTALNQAQVFKLANEGRLNKKHH
ncbi:protodermal factor 1 [Impatiens glandulifera]|uniref:protodermal factor 1 n=1 Tax=Impatiens glandulifera TaxID=253017 RepID=UPI001FB19BE2|nr:protodermal factor 1 [Impatiens glandulifera]